MLVGGFEWMGEIGYGSMDEMIAVQDRWPKQIVWDNGCLIWIGSKFNSGYGRINYLGKHWRAHRLIWTWLRGEIPAGMVVAHSCDRPECVLIHHLFLCTQLDNIRDREIKGRGGGGKANKLKTHCKRGHEFTPENTMHRSRGTRECLMCKRLRRE